MKNWKTTLFAGLAAACKGLESYGTPGLLTQIGGIGFMIFTFLTGNSAADSSSTK